MPQLPSHPRNSRIYCIPLTVLEVALGVGEPVLGWDWEGRGLTGWIVTILAEEENPNTPRTGVTERVQRQKLVSFADVYNAFLAPEIPLEKASRVRMFYDELNAYVDLSREEE